MDDRITACSSSNDSEPLKKLFDGVDLEAYSVRKTCYEGFWHKYFSSSNKVNAFFAIAHNRLYFRFVGHYTALHTIRRSILYASSHCATGIMKAQLR